MVIVGHRFHNTTFLKRFPSTRKYENLEPTLANFEERLRKSYVFVAD